MSEYLLGLSMVRRIILSISVPAAALIYLLRVQWTEQLSISINGELRTSSYPVFLRDQTWF